MSAFFDEFGRFYETSETGATSARLNKRYELIIASSRQHFSGARVLDIGCHDGRWSFAAHKAGAAHVTGIEPRGHLVRNARETFAFYGIADDRYRFVESDAFEFLSKCESGFDVILCLGFLYHTWRHIDLLAALCSLTPHHLILDTQIIPDKGGLPGLAVAEFLTEAIHYEGNAVADASARKGCVVVARPSRQSLALLLAHFGYRMSEVSVARFLCNSDGIPDYCEGSRGTFVAVPA
jgi:2-polyprenyl-3-methyl-5-hydroxy-6-metoxy-1,4-benzoquinol methylase